MNLFDRLRKLDMSLSAELDGKWSVYDAFNERAWFGKTPKEAISKAEQCVEAGVSLGGRD